MIKEAGGGICSGVQGSLLLPMEGPECSKHRRQSPFPPPLFISEEAVLCREAD